MPLPSWLRTLTSPFCPRQGRARRAARKLLLELLEDRLAPAILTVNTTADDNVRDAVLTLRESILLANGTLAFGTLTAAEQAQVSGTLNNPGTDSIHFNIPGAGPHTISPTSQLPTISPTNPVIIDGYTQPGASANTLAVGSNAVLKVELNGSNAGALANGLAISGGSTIKGLVINRFAAAGIRISGSGNSVQGNLIGTDVNGTVALGNQGEGINAIAGSSGTLIGGVTPEARNLISGNRSVGVQALASTPPCRVT